MIALLATAFVLPFAFANKSTGLPSGTVAGALETEEANLEQTVEFPLAQSLPTPPLPIAQNLAPVPKVTAAAVLIKDIETGMVMYEKQPEARLPIASLTKLMTALVVMDYGNPDDEVEISPTDLAVSTYRVDFTPGEKLTVRDLLIAMLVSSANDAALTLSRYASGSTENFVKDMNDKAVALGMNDTSFTNPVGFDDPKHFSTASDLALLVDEFLHHPTLLKMVEMKTAEIASVSGKETRLLATTNQLLRERPEIHGLKTGYTAEAKGGLILLVDKGGEATSPKYYMIILGSSDREREANLLLDWVDKEFVWTP